MDTSRIQCRIDQQTVATLIKYFQQTHDIPVGSLAHLGELVFHEFLDHLLSHGDIELLDDGEEQDELMLSVVLASRNMRRHPRHSHVTTKGDRAK